MIDIHSHLLPGVDDGSRELSQTVTVLESFAAQGVTDVVFTPHLRASRVASAPVNAYRDKFLEVQAAAPKGVRLHLGFEIMLDAPGIDLTGDGLALGESNAVLVEFSRRGLPPKHLEEIFRIRMSGRIPVIAHPERYPETNWEIVERWRGVGAVIQLDASAPLMAGRPRDVALDLLGRGLVDLLASDNHGDGRSLAPARQWLVEQGLERHAKLLTTTNAELLMRGYPPEAVPSIEFRRGFLDRLKQLVLGR